MPKAIKYSTTALANTRKKGNMAIGAAGVDYGTGAGYYSGIEPPDGGYTLYLNKATGGPSIYVANDDATLVNLANQFSQPSNFFAGKDFTTGKTGWSNYGANNQAVSIFNDRPYPGSTATQAMEFDSVSAGLWTGTSGMFTVGVTYTFSFWAKITTGSSFNIYWNNQNGSGETNSFSYFNTPLTTSWQRYTFTFTYNAARIYFYFYAGGGQSAGNKAIFTELTVSEGVAAGGPGMTTATEALAWFATQTDKVVLSSKDSFHNTITDNLALSLDANTLASYSGTGTTWYDLSSNSTNGTLVNGVSYSNSLMAFDGSNDYVEIPYSGNLTTTSYTFSFWAKHNGPRDGRRTMLGLSNGGQYAYFCFNMQIWDSNTQYLSFVGNGSTYTSFAFNLNDSFENWHHFTAVITPTSIKIYVNGELSHTNTATFRTSFDRIWIGQRGGQHWKGWIPNLQVHQKALSESEIDQTYYGADVPANPKMVLNRSQYGVTLDSTGWKTDLANQYSNLYTYGYTHADLNGDFDGLTAFTYCLWLKVYSHHTSYSQSPFYKYEGTGTAVIRLYDFGNWNNNNDNGRLTWYLNAGGGWGNAGASYSRTEVGETLFFCLQYNSTQGGQTWRNGVKVGTRTGRTGTVATNTTFFNIVPPEQGGQAYTKVKEAYIFNHEITDQEMIDLYNSTRGNYGL